MTTNPWPGVSSNSYTFNPSLGEIVLFAYGMCGIRRTALLQEHYQDAHMAVNFMLADWLNKGTNLFQVELITVPLVQGVATYAVDYTDLAILDAYVTTTGAGAASGSFNSDFNQDFNTSGGSSSGGGSIDRIILPISRTEYASYPNKQQQGFPTVFWMDRLLSPSVTLWPVPDGTQASFDYYALKQAQDANYDSGQNVAVPYAWLKALAYGLAEGLAPLYAPDRLAFLSPAAQAAYTTAADANVENAQQYISPQLAGYFR